VVRDPEKRAGAVEKIRAFATNAGLRVEGVVESPILGPAGNVEYLICLRT
jgi:23S rRNA (cytidine1920-2'-O)/16S rRNA (cytidine1409-2'-O)-methyltransferase